MLHFEIHVCDMDAAQAFYGGLFGWRFTPLPGAEAVAYHRVEGAGMSLGMLRRMGDPPAPGSPVRGGTLSVPVADCDASYAWALAHGGAEALPPADYPGFGRLAYVEDGQGNILGLAGPAHD